MRTLRALPFLALIAMGLVVYWPGLSGGFLFDDYANLVFDPDWKITSLDPAQWRRALSYGISSASGRPLAMLSFGINHYFTGMAPLPMKATNLAIHLFNGCLVYVLCRSLFSLTATPKLGSLAAWALAAAWALHPLQVSSVLYIVQRMELGAQCGVLLALIAYLKARGAQNEGRSAWRWLVLSALAVIAGLGFKESAILAPAYALLIELTLLRFRARDNRLSRAWIWAYASMSIIAVAVFFCLVVPHYSAEGAYGSRDFTLPQRLLTQLPVLAMYLGQSIWPLPDHLLFYYDQFPISTGLFSPPATAFSAALLMGLFLIAVATLRRQPLISLGIGWFFISHALTSNIVPLELAFEHRNYLALFGVLLAAAPPLAWLGRQLSPGARRSLAGLSLSILAALGLMQTLAWSDPARLATVLATRNPDSPRAAYEFAKTLLDTTRGDTSSPAWTLAQRELEHAASLPRSSPLAEQALITMRARTSQPVPPELWRSFRAKLERRPAGPDEVSALFGVSECRLLKQCVLDDNELFRTFLVALERNPSSAVLHSRYANYAFNALGERQLAVRMMREAVRLAPDDPMYQAGLAKFLLASNLRDREAQELISKLRAANRDGSLDGELRQIEQIRQRAH